jgi:hypothetical protein
VHNGRLRVDRSPSVPLDATIARARTNRGRLTASDGRFTVARHTFADWCWASVGDLGIVRHRAVAGASAITSSGEDSMRHHWRLAGLLTILVVPYAAAGAQHEEHAMSARDASKGRSVESR